MDSLQNKRSEQAQKIVKKPYTIPKIQIYGDLRQVTNAVTNDGPGLHDGKSDGPHVKATH